FELSERDPTRVTAWIEREDCEHVREVCKRHPWRTGRFLVAGVLERDTAAMLRASEAHTQASTGTPVREQHPVFAGVRGEQLPTMLVRCGAHDAPVRAWHRPSMAR